MSAVGAGIGRAGSFFQPPRAALSLDSLILIILKFQGVPLGSCWAGWFLGNRAGLRRYGDAAEREGDRATKDVDRAAL